jgi:hypothetical protein
MRTAPRIIGIIALIFCSCKSSFDSLTPIVSGREIETKLSEITIPNGYEIIRAKENYLRIKKEKDLIVICEVESDTIYNSCEIMLLPVRGTSSKMRSSKITTDEPYESNGFEIKYQHKLDPSGRVTHAYRLQHKNGGYRLILFGTNLTKQG